MLNPHGIQIETGLTVAALATRVRRLGGRIRSGVLVEGIEPRGDGVRVRASGETIEGDYLVVAAGAWTNALLAPLGRRLPLLRMLATRIVTNDLGLPSTIPTIQCREIPIWIREAGGGLTLGTTDGYCAMHRLEAKGETAIGQPRHAEFLDSLRQRQVGQLEQIFPPLVRSAVSSWAQGIPCYTPDHNLIVGPLPECDRMFVAAGDNETGVTHAPGIGRLLGELVLGRQPFIDPHRFSLNRFAAAGLDEHTIEREIRSLAVQSPSDAVA